LDFLFNDFEMIDGDISMSRNLNNELVFSRDNSLKLKLWQLD
jgi:hypothetical protein